MKTEDQPAVRERLQAIADRNGGRLTPQAVVEDARDESSPLNALFEWNVSKGFEKYLMDRARAVIRSVRIEVVRHEVAHKTPLFVRDPSAGPREQGYVSMRRLRTDADMARERVVAEFAAAGAALKRARAIAAVLGIGDEVDGVINDIGNLSQRVSSTSGASAPN